MFQKLSLIAVIILAAKMAVAAPYGMAGCGIGALIFADQPGKVQIASGILNNIISPQTSAITSGTSNCYEDSSTTASERYIEMNKESLQKDVARGEGETLAGLLTIWKCDDTASVSSVLQQNYGTIFAAPNSPQEIKGTLQNTIKSNSTLANACQALI